MVGFDRGAKNGENGVAAEVDEEGGCGEEEKEGRGEREGEIAAADGARAGEGEGGIGGAFVDCDP